MRNCNRARGDFGILVSGGFIYIAGSDLIPELQHCGSMKDTVLQFLAIVLGIAIMALLRILSG